MTARSQRRWGAPAAAVFLDAGCAGTAHPRPQQLVSRMRAAWRLAAGRGLGRASSDCGLTQQKGAEVLHLLRRASCPHIIDDGGVCAVVEAWPRGGARGARARSPPGSSFAPHRDESCVIGLCGAGSRRVPVLPAGVMRAAAAQRMWPVYHVHPKTQCTRAALPLLLCFQPRARQQELHPWRGGSARASRLPRRLGLPNGHCQQGPPARGETAWCRQHLAAAHTLRGMSHLAAAQQGLESEHPRPMPSRDWGQSTVKAGESGNGPAQGSRQVVRGGMVLYKLLAAAVTTARRGYTALVREYSASCQPARCGATAVEQRRGAYNREACKSGERWGMP